MKYLGIDYGRSKVGIAVSGGSIAAPLLVYKNIPEFEIVLRIKRLSVEENVNGIVVGISENESARQAQKFADKLKEETDLPVYLVDETLSTHDANDYALEAGIKQKKRRIMEDAFAAAIILQRYLESK